MIRASQYIAFWICTQNQTISEVPGLTTEVPLSCNQSYFNCGINTEYCIPWLWACDGDSDCPGDSDESSDLCKFSGKCGGNFTTPHGLLTSPSYPEIYPNNIDCVYTITQPTGAAILLNVLSFNTERFSDFLEIRDGPSDASPLLAKLSGEGSENLTIRSNKNRIWIK